MMTPIRCFLGGLIAAQGLAAQAPNWPAIDSAMGRPSVAQPGGLFARELLRLYHERPPGSRVPALYPAILQWAARQ